jgi:hypothetical protein
MVLIHTGFRLLVLGVMLLTLTLPVATAAAGAADETVQTLQVRVLNPDWFWSFLFENKAGGSSVKQVDVEIYDDSRQELLYLGSLKNRTTALSMIYPKRPQQRLRLELVLKGQNDELLYRRQLELNQKARVINVDLNAPLISKPDVKASRGDQPGSP